MAGALYTAARTAFAKGEIAWVQGASDFRAVLVNVPTYTLDVGHTSLANIPAGARRSTSILTVLDPSGGSVRSNPIAFNGVTGLTASQAIVVYKEGVSEALSPLLAYFDTGTNFPVPTNSGSVQLNFTSNKLFALGGNV